MKLSVIIPAFNREAFVGSAIRSLTRQRGAAELDIVVVDDGSTDATAAVVEGLAGSTPGIRIVRQPNRGVTRARNAGLASLPADTDLVTFLDSDDLCPDGRIAAELRRFADEPGLELTYGLMTLVDAVDDVRLEPAAGCRSVTVRGISLSAGIFRRHVFDRVGGLDESFGHAEDADFLFRVFERSPRMALTDVVAVIYRRHAGNLTKDKENLRRDIMKAIFKSVQRRRADPSLRALDGIFDLNALLGVSWL